MNRYSPPQRMLHWLGLLLLAVAYVAIEFRAEFPRGSAARLAMVQTHFWAGLAVLVLTVPRLWLRERLGAPAITPPLPAWQALPAKILHLALYAFLLGQPLLGLATAWTDGKAVLIPFLGWELPALLNENKQVAHRLEELHETIGEAFYYLIGFHALAAFWHHFVRKDDTLRRMI